MLSTDPKIRALQERALAMGKQATIDTKQLELDTEAKWEADRKQGEVIKFAEKIFNEPVQTTLDNTVDNQPSTVDNTIPF